MGTFTHSLSCWPWPGARASWARALYRQRYAEPALSADRKEGRQTIGADTLMNDPHVESLTYCIRKSDHVSFDKAAPLTVKKPQFTVSVAEYKAVFNMVDHF